MHYNFDEVINREGTNSLKYDGKEKYFGTHDVLPMWVADMDFKTPDFIMEAIRKRASHEIMGYSIKPQQLFSAVINWMYYMHKWTIQPEWITTTPGVVSALNFGVLAFSNPGDKIIIQTPVYFPFFTAINDHKREIAINQLVYKNGNYTIDLEHFESLIDTKTKVFILCNPHNPVGRVWNRDELLAMGNICLKHNIIIIADEIHSDLVLNGHTHIPMATLSEEIAAITITTMAASKTFNIAGLASSVSIISNPEIKRNFEKLPNSLHIGSINLFGATAMEAAYTHGQEWLHQMLAYLENNVAFVEQHVRKNFPDINVIRPEGTYMIWLDCHKLQERVGDLKTFFVKNAKVGFNNGTDFGPGGAGFMRMNVGCPLKIVQESMKRIGDALSLL